MNRSVQILVMAVIAIMICGCDGYGKLLKSTDYDSQYKAAVAYYEEGNYNRARQLLENLQVHYRSKDNAENILWYYCNALMNLDDYFSASYYFNQFNRKYPYSTHAEEALYLSAYSKYLQAPSSSLDQTLTKESLSEFERFIEKYPQSVRVPQINNYVDTLNARLEKKDFDIAMVYYKVEQYHAAYQALKNFLNQYPDSQYKEQAMYTVIMAGYKYASNSQEDKMADRLRLVINDFDRYAPQLTNKKYLADAQQAYTKAKALQAQLEQSEQHKTDKTK